MIVVVDYGAGNIASVLNMLAHIGTKAKATSKCDDILGASKIILPGVGAFDAGMRTLNELGLVEPIREAVKNKRIPILGICLGAQLLGRRSEEGILPGLGLIDMDIVHFSKQEGRKVPHMGWNYISIQRPNALVDGLNDDSRFYFVHSYYMKPDKAEDAFLTTNYYEDFASGVASGNIAGVQFHPEKSHKYGMTVFKNFVEKF